MARKPSRTRPCGPQDAAARYDKAKAFADLAELDPESADGPTRSAAVSNAVLAGIAAADSICSRRLGRHADRATRWTHGRASQYVLQHLVPATQRTFPSVVVRRVFEPVSRQLGEQLRLLA